MAHVNREHILQVKLRKWVRDAVAVPHVFLAFDSAKQATMNQRAREASRGVATGTPDCVLHIDGVPPIYCELKAPGNKPTPAQEYMGVRLMEAGCFWSWLSSIEDYRLWMVALGVPLQTNAEYLALIADGQVWTAIARAEAKRPAKPRGTKAEPRYTAGKSATKRWAKAGIIAG
jgi:hypothetical protein